MLRTRFNIKSFKGDSSVELKEEEEKEKIANPLMRQNKLIKRHKHGIYAG